MIADRVLSLLAAAEIGAVARVDEGEDAAAHRDPRLALVARFGPRLAKGADLLGLLDVERLPVSSNFSVELCRFMPFAAQTAVASEPAPHQMRSRRPSE